MKKLSIDKGLLSEYVETHTLRETASYFNLSYQQVKDYCHHHNIPVKQREIGNHGCSYEPQYIIWKGMMSRCYKAKNKDYPRYGGRGITVCKEWHKIENFVEWCQQNGWKKGLQLDRKDNNAEYSPDNCRFVTGKENMSNRRNTIKINGVPLTKILSDSQLNPYKIERHTAWFRLKKLGWSIEKVLSTPT